MSQKAGGLAFKASNTWPPRAKGKPFQVLLKELCTSQSWNVEYKDLAPMGLQFKSAHGS